MLGHQDQALSRGEQAVLWGRSLRHSHSLLYALAHTASLLIAMEKMQPAFDALEEATAIATQQGFPFWLAYLTMLRGYVLVTRWCVAQILMTAASDSAVTAWPSDSRPQTPTPAPRNRPGAGVKGYVRACGVLPDESRSRGRRGARRALSASMESSPG